MTQAEATARVMKGAAHLDLVRPNWFRQIDVGTLTLHDPCGCIVGQLAGNYFSLALCRLSISRADGYAMGFDITSKERNAHPSRWNCREVYQPLQNAWVVAIADRLLAASTANITEAPALVTA